MRLLLAIPYYAPAYAFGGSVTVAETVVDGFLAAGHEVTVATTDVLDEHQRIDVHAPAVPAGAEVRRFPNVSHRLAAAANGYAPRGLRAWLRREIHRFDAVLLHDFYSAVSVMAARAAERAGVPYALQPLGTVGADPERGRPVVKQAFVRVWGHRTLAGAAALIHSTDHEAQDFLGVGADRGKLVRLPLPLDLPEPPSVPLAAAPTVVSVGRLHPIKGIDRLIRACAIARRDVPELRLEIAGPGERYQRVLEGVVAEVGLGDAVTFHGFVSAEEKLRLLASAHAFALLSAAEGLPMASLEAMACGAPAVLSTGCHVPEVHDVAGLVTDGSPEATAPALVALLSDAALRQRLSTGAKAFAAQFRREVVMPQMVELFERLAAQPPRRA
ncbi:MAG TPA: glycosyltransferase [Baekduia sp.]|nr:glycosyltransferase [Baekduia sp.]